MTYDDDDPIYEDDEDYYDYDADDEFDDDEDESLASSKSSVNPFSGRSSGLPGSDRSRLGSSGLTSGSRYGSGTTPRYGSGTGGSSTRGSFSQPKSPISKDDLDRRFSSSSSGGSSGSRSGSSSFRSPSGGYSSSRPRASSADSLRQSLAGTSDSKKDDDKKDDKSSGGSRFGGLASRMGFGGSKDDDKSKSSSSSGSSSSGRSSSSNFRKSGSSPSSGGSSSWKGSSSSGSFRSGSSSFKKDDDKKDDKKDDSSGSGFSLGGLAGRLPFGGSKDDDKKDDRKAGSGAKKSGGFSSRIPGRGGKSSRSSASSQSTGSFQSGGMRSPSGSRDKKDDSGGRLSGIASGLASRMPFGGSKGDDSKKDDKKGGGQAASSSKGGSRFGGRFTGGSQSSGSAKSSSRSQSAATSKGSGSGGKSPFARARQASGGLFNRGDAQKAASSTRATSKAPKLEGEGLTLDNKLDIVGVGLVFGALVLFFSAISAEQAAISGIHNFFGELLGWGALGVPIGMFAVGAWLIVRHFGEDAPTVDPLRIVGLVMGYICLLTLFQYIESFSYPPVPDVQFLERFVEVSAQNHAGGGAIGSGIYLWMVFNVTEIGGFFLLVFGFLISAMFVTRLSASEIAIFFISIWRSFQTSLQRRSERRRAQAQLAQPTISPDGNTISVSKPSPAELGAGAAANALPAPGQSLEDRNILIRRGGQTVSGAQAAAANQPAAQTDSGSSGGGLFGFLQRGKQPEPAASDDQNGGLVAAAGGLFGGLLSRGSGEKDPVPNPTQQPATQPSQAQPALSQPGATTPSPAGAAASGASGARLSDLLGRTPQLEGQQAPQQPAAASQPAASTQAGTSQQPAAQSQQPAAQTSPFQRPQQPAANSPAGPGQSQPAAATSQSPPTGQPQQPQTEAGSLTARMDRLNAIRSGQTGHPAKAETQQQRPAASVQPAAQTPVAQPNTRPEDAIPGGGQQTLINPGKSQRVIQPPQKPVSTGPTNQTRKRVDWRLPDYRTLLTSGSEQEFDRSQLLEKARVIEDTLQSFGAPGRVVEVNTGPVITQFGVEPAYLTARSGKKHRVKVGAIAQLDKDLQLALGAKSIRIEAPVPGKGFVGIEVPNDKPSLVSLRDVMESDTFQGIKSPLGIGLGQSVDGSPIAADLSSMPHLLIAGTTGSGKSVCVNSIICSLMACNPPDKVKFVMVDPKRVELTGYNGVPHLVAPVVVDLERIVGVLKWVTREMDERYKQFSNAGARNIEDFNKHLDPEQVPMPYLIIIIDELADLMMLAPEETERTITRIAALARATGIHLVIATQRPSVDVVTGLIKANFPARIAFAVAGGVDSRVILDQPGAERLLGRGDMLYLSPDSPAPLRLQGVFVSDMEITNITRYWKKQALQQPDPMAGATITAESAPLSSGINIPKEPTRDVLPRGERVRQQAFWDEIVDDDDSSSDGSGDDSQEDELYEEAVALVRRLNKASVSLLQRRLRIGYTRAARLVDTMEDRGVVGPPVEGSKPRKVLPPSS